MRHPWNREALYHRHHLSHQQIDDLLVEKESAKYPELKGQMLGKVHDFLAVSELFFSQSIPFIPLKGPMLSYRLYGDMSYRNFGDLDFLMESKYIEKAIKALKEKGYSCPSYDWHLENNKTDVFFRHHHHIILDRPGSNIHLELHWRLFTYSFGKNGISDEMIAANTAVLNARDRVFRVFNPELELLYLIIHGGLHAWQWLRWLVDIQQYLETIPIDEEKFIQLSESLQAHRMVALCNAMLNQYFPDSKNLPGTIKPSPSLLNFSRARLESAEEGDFSLAGRVRMHLFRAKCFPGIKYKSGVVKHVLFYPEQLEDKRLAANRFLYYLGGITKKIKRRL